MMSNDQSCVILYDLCANHRAPTTYPIPVTVEFTDTLIYPCLMPCPHQQFLLTRRGHCKMAILQMPFSNSLFLHETWGRKRNIQSLVLRSVLHMCVNRLTISRNKWYIMVDINDYFTIDRQLSLQITLLIPLIKHLNCVFGCNSRSDWELMSVFGELHTFP